MKTIEIEYVITYKEEPMGLQREVVRTNQVAANEFAFGIEVNGGVAVVTPRAKKNHVNKQDTWLDNN